LGCLLNQDPVARATLRQQIADSDAQLKILAARLDTLDLNRDDVVALGKMTSAWDAFAAWRDREILGPAGEGDPAVVLAAYRTEGIQLTNAFAVAAEEYRQGKRTAAAELALSAASVYQGTFNLAIAWSGVDS
jgi:hypothetical protein